MRYELEDDLLDLDDRVSTEQDKQLLEAFASDDETTEPSQAKKAVLAVSFLLQWQANAGNYPLSGKVADGLGEILVRAARFIDFNERHARYVALHPVQIETVKPHRKEKSAK